MKYTREVVIKELIGMADTKYSAFSKALIPGEVKIMGVRIPMLRRLAKQIAVSDYQFYLENSCDNQEFYEETAIESYVIGYMKCEPEYRLMMIRRFIPKIDNWSINDGFCATLKFIKKEQQLMWNFILPFCSSEKEYEIRFASIILMDYYLSDEYFDKTLVLLGNMKHEEYYAKMGIAWAVASAYAVNPEKTKAFLESWNTDIWTYNKAIQKMKESYRVSADDKIMLEKMKK